jgi:hypothetical protein
VLSPLECTPDKCSTMCDWIAERHEEKMRYEINDYKETNLKGAVGSTSVTIFIAPSYII